MLRRLNETQIGQIPSLIENVVLQLHSSRVPGSILSTGYVPYAHGFFFQVLWFHHTYQKLAGRWSDNFKLALGVNECVCE